MDIKHSIIAFAGDWHGNTRYATKALRHIKKNNGDVVIHTGDFGAFPDFGYMNAINEEAEKLGIYVLFVDGNHENHSWLLDQPVDDDGVRRLFSHVWHLPRGFRWEWDGVTFLALGGAFSIDKHLRTEGVDWWPEETITVEDMYNSVQGGLVDVMITHDCPASVHSPVDEFPKLDYATLRKANRNRRALELVMAEVEPKYLFHGHMHVRYDSLLREPGLRECRVSGLDRDKSPFTDNLVFMEITDLML